MGTLGARNLTLMAAIISCFLQTGGGLFAISVLVRTITEAPPRSFAILEGAYRYDSSAFWQTLPPVTAILVVVALISNWKSHRRWLIVTALVLFVLGGILSGTVLEPEFASITEGGYRDVVDPELRERAQSWYALDWAVWSLTLTAGFALLLAIVRPATNCGNLSEALSK